MTNIKLTIEDMRALAEKRGGKCLSAVYTNNKTKLKWECDQRHQWESTPSDVKNGGNWCRRCSGYAKLNIEDMHAIAAEHGGKFLSPVYVNDRTNHLWQCEEGHQWSARPSNVRRKNSWCPACKAIKGRNPELLKEVTKIAKKLGGKLISTEYKGGRTHCFFKCKAGHQFNMRPDGVVSGSWCSECGNASRRFSIEHYQKIAEAHNGKCLSTEVKNKRDTLNWECEEGHQWAASCNAILQNQWCRECSKGKSEKMCRAVFENIFEVDFPSNRPVWMPSKGTKNLELDGYNESLKLAFEHQGLHHYQPVKYGGRSYAAAYKSFKAQVVNDRRKRQLCVEHGVTLIRIPTVGKFTHYKKLRETIIHLLERAGFPVPESANLSPARLRS